MAWRVHLTNQAIQSLHVLAGKRPVLAAWSRRDSVAFYDLNTGDALGEQTLPVPPVVRRQSDEWQAYVNALTGPQGDVYLPVVRTALLTIHTSDDGKMRLYQQGDNELILETEGNETPLGVENVERFLAVELDRALGLIAALDEGGKLHLYQQSIRVGAFDIGLQLQSDLRPSLALSQGGGTVFASDGQSLVVVDTGGKVRKRVSTHYYIGLMACSPGGGMLLTSDLDSGVIRVYTSNLTLTHQRHAFDLLLNATETQLFSEVPPEAVAPSALAASSKGVFVFAMSGVICATDTAQMNQLPRPQALL